MSASTTTRTATPFAASTAGRTASAERTALRSATRRIAVAAEQMYDAEVALHIARQSDIDLWVRAAADRLHQAITEHTVAVSERNALLGLHAIAA